MSIFHAVFVDYTGLTPTDYLTRVRIGQACRLLRESDAGILQVAMSCGFGSVSRFYEAFRQAIGTSPGRWRIHRSG